MHHRGVARFRAARISSIICLQGAIRICLQDRELSSVWESAGAIRRRLFDVSVEFAVDYGLSAFLMFFRDGLIGLVRWH
jgi:hypothetical protein